MNKPAIKAMPDSPLVLVKPEDAAHVWPHVEEWIKQANAHGNGRWLPHDWLTKVMTGQAEMYVGRAEGFVLFVELMRWPRSLELVVSLFGGQGDHDYTAINQAVDGLAKARGCDAVQIDGRPGWRKTLKTLGYDMSHCSWRKELDHARR